MQPPPPISCSLDGPRPRPSTKLGRPDPPLALIVEGLQRHYRVGSAEIGLYKSLGATTGDVRTIFLTEAAWLGLLGGLGGIGLARAVCWLLGHAIEYYASTQEATLPGDIFRFPPALLAGAILFSVLISVASGVYPASRAARIDPIRALRGE